MAHRVISETRWLSLLFCLLIVLPPGTAVPAAAQELHAPPLLLSPPDSAHCVLLGKLHFRILAPLPGVIDSLDSLILPLRFSPDGFLFFSDSIRLHTTLGDRVLLVSANIIVYNRGTVNSLHVHRLSHRSKAIHVRNASPFTVPPQDSTSVPLRFVPGALRPPPFSDRSQTRS